MCVQFPLSSPNLCLGQTLLPVLIPGPHNPFHAHAHAHPPTQGCLGSSRRSPFASAPPPKCVATAPLCSPPSRQALRSCARSPGSGVPPPPSGSWTTASFSWVGGSCDSHVTCCVCAHSVSLLCRPGDEASSFFCCLGYQLPQEALCDQGMEAGHCGSASGAVATCVRVCVFNSPQFKGFDIDTMVACTLLFEGTAEVSASVCVCVW